MTIAAAGQPPRTLVRAVAGDGAVLCTWRPIAGATGYEVERSQSKSGPWRRVGTSSRSPFVDRVSTARPLYYRVLAKNGRRSVGRVSAPAMTSRIPRSASVSAVAGESASVCTWSPVAEPLVSGYLVESAPATGGPWTGVGTVASPRIEDRSAGGRASWYRVRAVAGGEVAGDPSAPVRARPVVVPLGLAAIAGDGIVVCTWASVPASEAVTVQVERSSSFGGPWIAIGTATGASFTDDRPSAGPAYYRVRALASSGVAGAASAPAIPLVIPVPAGVVAARGASELACTWLPSADLAVTYRLERASDPSGPFETVEETAGTCYRAALDREGAPYYRVRAMFGAIPGPASGVVTASVLAVPERLTVSAGDMVDVLAWGRGDADGSAFAVERATSTSGPWERVARTVDASFEDSVPERREWYYRVRSTGPLGIESDPCLPVANSLIRMHADVPPAGRVMRAANGRMSLQLPAACFASTSAVDVTERSLPAVGALIPVTSQFTFEAAAPLSVPALVEVAYRVPDGYGTAAGTISRASDWMSLETSTGAWVPVPTTVDTTASTLSASMPHFSEWRGAMQPHGTSLTLVQSNSCNGVCHAVTTVNGRQVVASSRDSSVCYQCHAGANAADAHGIGVDGPNIRAEFMQYGGADAFDPSTQSRHPVSEPGAATTVSFNCVSCHDPHKSPAEAPQLLRATDAVTGKPVASAGGASAGNAFCWACHGTKSNARVNLGVPDYYASSGGDKKTAYVSSGHRDTACVGCHEGHGSRVESSLLKGTRTDTCLACHGGASPVDGVTIVAGHRIVSAGASLPVDAGLPCDDCHGPHGSLRGNAALLSDALGGSLDTSSAVHVRRFCLTCHTTSDGLGWDSAAATYTAPAAGAKVEGLPRTGGATGSGPGGSGQNWLRLRPATGHASGETAGCYGCHGNDYSSPDADNVHKPATYTAARHTATPASQTVTILGVTFGPYACSDCHGLELGPEHAKTGSSSAAAGCSACHPDPRASLLPSWSRGCAQGGCHTASSSAPMHAGIDAPHVTGAQSCTAEGCHGGAGNIAAVHSDATTTTPSGTRAGCQVCHAAGTTPSATCSDCHDVDAPHGDMGDTHRSAPGSGWIEVFPNSEGPSCHGWDCHGTGMNVACDLCHTVADVATIHANKCEVCHPSPRSSFTTWTKGCQQGGCHPTYHARVGYVHDSLVNSGNCSCHPYASSDYPADPALCVTCHSPTGDTVAPTTTSNAVASYSGAALIRLTPSDPMPGSGAALTYYILDGGPQKTSRSVYVPAPAIGSAAHSLQFWSTDAAGNVESPRKTASFIVRADVTPPVTTSNAQTSYVLGPNTGTSITIALSATDESYDGVKATYYRLDGGATTAGTAITVPGPVSPGSVAHTLQFWSVDAANNTETVKTASFTIAKDLTAPTVTFSPSAYYKANVAIPISAADSGGSAVSRISFHYDSGVWYNVYAASGSVYSGNGGLGTHVISYYAIDGVGNQSALQTAAVCYDTSLPFTWSSAVPSYTGTATILLTPTDSYSGVAATYYRVDTGSQQAGTTITVLPPASGSASHVVYYWSVDRAGNAELSKSSTFTVLADSRYTLTYAAGANGSVTGTSPQTVSAGGSGTPVSAVANSGYHFVNWSDGVTANPRTDTNVTANKSVTAIFAINTYTLTYTAGAGGTVSGTSPQTVTHGSSGTTVTAVPNLGQHFVSWSDGVSTPARRDTDVTATKTVTADFAPDAYPLLTYLAGTGGSILGTATQSVPSGGNGAPVTAVADTGYHFVSWSDGSTANPRTDTAVMSDITVTATFSLNTSHTVTYLAGSNGTLSGASPQTVPWGGTSTAVTAVPNTGYYFSSWSDGSVANPRTDANVTADATYTANFAAQTFGVYSYAYAGGSVSTTGWAYLPYGSSYTVTATPNAGYRTAALLVDSDSINGWRLPAQSYTFPSVTATHYLYAYFGLAGTHSRVYTNSPHGSCAPYGLQNVADGASAATVTASPYGGYHFANWSDGITSNPRHDTNVTTDAIVTPVFAPNTYTMTYTVGPNGSIAGQAVQSVAYDSRGTTVTAVGDAGYHFLAWSDGVFSATRRDLCQGDRTVRADFAANANHDVLFSSDAEGYLSGPWAQSVAPGASATTVTAVVYDSYHWEFSYWEDDLGNVSYANPLVIANVARSQHWTAHYYNYYTGSCPFLFTWNGSDFGFESDLFSTGKLGAVRSGGTYQKPNPNDYYVIENEPAEKDGALEMRLVEERPETDYLDEYKLYAVDVPAGADVEAVKIPAGGTYQPMNEIVHSVSADPLHVHATHVQDGTDVTQDVFAAHDGRYATLNPDRESPSYQTIEIDPGDVAADAPFKLIVEGNSWTPETDAGKAIAAEIPNSLRQKVEVVGADGQWTALAGTWPKPAEFARPYILDLTGRFPTGDHRVRLTFVFETCIDSIRVDTTSDVPLSVTEVPMTSAVLGHHGFDLHDVPGDIFRYVYGPPTANGAYMPGLYTKFGEVTPLLAGTDDEFVIFGGGDELTMRFQPPAPPAAGMTRRYVVYANGYYKWANTDIAQTVDPLPFAAMSNYPYPDSERYPDDEEHQTYLATWNTRREIAQ